MTELQVGFDSPETKKNTPPIIYIELCDKRASGFVRDGTRGTKFEEELDSPAAEFIPNFGFRKGRRKVIVGGKKAIVNGKEVIEGGKEVIEEFHEPIRYIKDSTEISVQRQKELGIERHRIGTEDLIIVEKGNFFAVREGSHIGLYDYLMEAFYNESNPDRSPSAAKLYRVIELGKEEEEMNEDDMLMADAVKFVSQFYQKTGAKTYKYNEEKINGLCELFAVFAETMPGKISALNAIAKFTPKAFLEKATKFEQTKVTEVTHALQLNVIIFKGNTVQYSEKDKVIATLGSGNMSHDKKIEKLADLFGTPDFKAAYDEFQLELEIAKERSLKNA